MDLLAAAIIRLAELLELLAIDGAEPAAPTRQLARQVGLAFRIADPWTVHRNAPEEPIACRLSDRSLITRRIAMPPDERRLSSLLSKVATISGRIAVGRVDATDSKVLHHVIAALGAEPVNPPAVSPRVQKKAQAPRRSKLEWLAAALIIVQQQPYLPNRQIAEMVGVDPGTLSRSNTFRTAAACARDHAEPPLGQRAAGRIEAVDEPDE